MEDIKDIQAILQKYWNYSSFRYLQEDIIHSVLEGKDTLALLPTGGGKSICFQVPTMAKEGICIVITPLLSLMKDQVTNLLSKGITAATIHTGMHLREIELILTNCIRGKTKFLYLSPERLKNELLKNCVRQMQVCLLAVDESHCISQWGYDFRPPYLEIATFRELLPPDVPVLALTATATDDVVKEIQRCLHFRAENVFKQSFYRENLTYYVFKEENKYKRLLKIITRTPGTGIIYVRSRRRAQEVVDFLIQNKLSADFYHAGLTLKVREEKQRLWMLEKTRIIVATNAFGMGIDKANVRFVVHLDIPDNLEAYFQEAGRGGRDEKRAYSILLYENKDITELHKHFETSYPPIEMIRTIYQALCNFFQLPMGNGEGASFDFNMYSFVQNYHFKHVVVFNSLKFMERAGFISITEAINNPSKVYIPLSREELYRFQVANEQYDDFIKLLLRSYAGLFSVFVPIQEKELARRSALPITIVAEALKQLNAHGVIIYQPQTENPKITFLQNRVESRHLLFSQQVYDDRKKNAEKRLEAVVFYVNSTTQCRSRFLLSYFGQQHSPPCGKCDVCLRHRETLSREEFEFLQKEILSLLQNEEQSIDSLLEKLHYPSVKLLEVIRWLLENDFINQSINKLILNNR